MKPNDMWSYCVRMLRVVIATDGLKEAERRAKEMEFNCGFDAFKLVRAAKTPPPEDVPSERCGIRGHLE